MEKVHEDGNQTLGQCQRKDILRAFIFRSFLSFYLLKFFFLCVGPHPWPVEVPGVRDRICATAVTRAPAVDP